MNFLSIWQQGDPIVNLVFIILIIMSILSWYVIFYKALKLKKEYGFYKNFCQEISNKKEWFLNIDNIASNQQSKGSTNLILTRVSALKSTLENYKSHEAKKEILTMHLAQTLDEIRFWLDRGLTILASIGSIAPFVGLFGTVWGIYHALSKISIQGSVGLNVVAGPIAEALIATAIGLATAIPAVLAYNSFVRLNRLLIQNLRHLAEQITVYLSNQNL
jgi:biopolymer transport protein ExbB